MPIQKSLRTYRMHLVYLFVIEYFSDGVLRCNIRTSFKRSKSRIEKRTVSEHNCVRYLLDMGNTRRFLIKLLHKTIQMSIVIFVQQILNVEEAWNFRTTLMCLSMCVFVRACACVYVCVCVCICFTMSFVI